ncbi:hypothetical protein SCHPADRAFT_559920 [Schizopora paradoxa]|uniref:Uncharacterized protein n=1 Tax=Schizopora paradoxa TaxID=27342 RepID=A0A0H2RCV9_9AGAM|nr:hypothetical protein SCHPADRAFT_559920 [Schizopora paradoxa]
MQKVVSTIPLNAQPIYVRFWVQQGHIALLAIGVALYILGLGIYVVDTQRIITAVIPCILAGVWGCSVLASVVSWESVRNGIMAQTRNHSNKEKVPEKQITDVIIDRGRDKEDSPDLMSPPNEDDERVSAVEAVAYFEEEQNSVNYDTKLVNEYVRRLDATFLKERFESGTFPAFTRACHEFVCLVYDVEHDFAYQILTSSGIRPSAEHAEWSPNGEYLLLRSSMELWLWKTPTHLGKDTFKYLETDFKIRKSTYRYIKWINRSDFLLLMDDNELSIIDRKRGQKEAIHFALPSDYLVRQVFTLDPNLERILCLVEKTVAVNSHVRKHADFIFVFHKPTDAVLPFTPGSRYQPKQKRLLHTNVKNLKMSRSRRHMIVNYCMKHVEDKVQHFAVENSGIPELWCIQDEEGGIDIHVSSRKDTMREIDPPDFWTIEFVDSCEASFIGPYQRIVMFHDNERVFFCRFDDSKDSVQMDWFRWIILKLKSRGFVDPVITWGETYEQPVCFATNIDGDGRIFCTSYQENLSIEASGDRPASVVKDADADKDVVDAEKKVERDESIEHPSVTTRSTKETGDGEKASTANNEPNADT